MTAMKERKKKETNAQISDVLTKATPTLQFENLRLKLGVELQGDDCVNIVGFVFRGI